MATATFKGTTITEKNVEQAIKGIKTNINGVPKNRKAHKHLVEFKHIFFPVKYVVSETYKNVTGKELNPNKDFGSTEAIEFLKELGFYCVEFKEYKRPK